MKCYNITTHICKAHALDTQKQKIKSSINAAQNPQITDLFSILNKIYLKGKQNEIKNIYLARGL